jgi:microcystin-dependent protein
MDAFLGEIRMFTGTFAPEGWFYCDGQALLISQYQALYSLIGTAFGGDGTTNFCLPDFRSRVPIHRGQGTGLSQYTMGQKAGTETVALTAGQLPAHSHTIAASSHTADLTPAPGNIIASAAPKTFNFTSTKNADSTLASTSVSSTGGSQAHPNIQPSLVVAFIICVNGMYPNRPS